MIIPAVDLINGRVVRLFQGDYGQKTEYSWTPQERFDLYVSEGARQLHLVDLDGAKDASKRQLAAIRDLIRNTPAPIQIGIRRGGSPGRRRRESCHRFQGREGA